MLEALDCALLRPELALHSTTLREMFVARGNGGRAYPAQIFQPLICLSIEVLTIWD